jgi:hypothetical protein
MSTKTTFKRVALVAVAALGLGVLGSAPSFAAASASVVTTSTTVAYGDSKTVPTVGSTVTLDALLAITANASAATTETSTVVATLTTIPNNSLLGADSVTASVTGAAAAYATATASTNVLRFYMAEAEDTTGKIGTATFTPDVPGKYVLTLSPKNGGVAGVTDSAGTARTVEINVGGIAITQGG